MSQVDKSFSFGTITFCCSWMGESGQQDEADIMLISIDEHGSRSWWGNNMASSPEGIGAVVSYFPAQEPTTMQRK